MSVFVPNYIAITCSFYLDVVLGVQSDTVNGINAAGSVYLYTREKNSMMPNQPGTKVVSPESTTKLFGGAVALNRDFMVVSSKA